jgi:NAD(P)-dependent dehydrogenase (short-subunit alcohol dehydrogenase family)
MASPNTPPSGSPLVPQNAHSPQIPLPINSGEPRVWLLTSGSSAIGLSITRAALQHGDIVIAGLEEAEFQEANLGTGGEVKSLRSEVEFSGDVFGEGALERYRHMQLDIRSVASCQIAVAEVLKLYGRIDICLNCTSEAILGTVEELSLSAGTQALTVNQFETNFFGGINIIKTCLPSMRERRNGHLIVITGLGGHIGTPALSMYCAASWALEGFCDVCILSYLSFQILQE